MAFLSRCELRDIEVLYDASQAIHASFELEGHSMSVTNVHLPWDSVLQREKQALFLERYLSSSDADTQYCFLLGDFNADSDSSVHRFLTGLQSLYGEEASPPWLDLKAEYAELSGLSFPPSLDCLRNSRWEGKNRLYAPEDFDRILLRDRWHPFSILDAGMIGTKKDEQTNLHPSDHYGVYVDFQLV